MRFACRRGCAVEPPPNGGVRVPKVPPPPRGAGHVDCHDECVKVSVTKISEQTLWFLFPSFSCAWLVCDEMNGSVFVAIIPVLFCLSRFWKPIQGGICWTTMNKHGLCTDILSENMTKEECCKQFPHVNTAWSKEDLDSGNLFFLRVLGGGVSCYSCKETCKVVDCGPGKKCVVRSGRPKCVCSPCKERGKNSRGPVCGSDGNTYLNVCRLKKRACRRKKSSLTVAYNGFCQSSCDRINCPEGKFCLLDQNLSPHCVRCMIRCAKTPENSRPVCGADGVTYANICVLRQKACMSGKAIPVAYKGKCKAKATCGSVRCKNHQSCLTDASSGMPRCVTCNARCPTGISKELGGPICGTNNKTYHSWCHMVKDACATGFVIETKFQGNCDEGDKISELVSVTVTSPVNASRSFFRDLVDFQ